MKTLNRFGLICALSAISAFQLSAGLAVTFNFDENGNGSYTLNSVTTPMTFALAPDPGPGGLGSVLTYTYTGLAPGVQGDLGLTDADTSNGVLDVIRFNGNRTIVFYSDNLGGADALADTTGPPTALYTNVASIPEVGPEGNNGATYVPTSGQPGFGNSDFTFTYNIVSDSVPEPGTAALMMLAMAGMFGLRKLRRRHN